MVRPHEIAIERVRGAVESYSSVPNDPARAQRLAGEARVLLGHAEDMAKRLEEAQRKLADETLRANTAERERDEAEGTIAMQAEEIERLREIESGHLRESALAVIAAMPRIEEREDPWKWAVHFAVELEAEIRMALSKGNKGVDDGDDEEIRDEEIRDEEIPY